jgi:alpha-L-rhamnosidase
MRTLTLAFVSATAAAQSIDSSARDGLIEGFRHPPQSARPLVWWHWMNGNITQEGVRLDIEWMHRIGLAGFQTFDVARDTPQVVDHRLPYMTSGWKDAFRYATNLANQLDMEEAIGGSPGWSETGGPWVPPAQGMKKYVWSETLVKGGEPFTSTLTPPPSKTGAFQNAGVRDILPAPDGAAKLPQFYADAAVVAYRKRGGGQGTQSLGAKISASAGSPDFSLLADGDLEKTTSLPIPAEGQSVWIQYEFAQASTIRSITIATREVGLFEALISGVGNPERSLQVSDDGRNFRQVAKLLGGGAPQLTVSFSPITARYFRILFKRVSLPQPPIWASGLDLRSFRSKIPPTPKNYEIAELVLHQEARVNHFEDKAAFSTVGDLDKLATLPVSRDQSIPKSDIIDLTSKMRPDGTLDWTPPTGEWVVVRLGYSLLGITNHPATAEATGLEVDKLNGAFVKNYMDAYLDSYKETVGGEMMGKRGIRSVITDSWEAGSQNWTDDMLVQFRKRRGYDPIPWMPVLTGRIVESSEASDKFLWDFRKTIADLIADEHYGQIHASLKERDMGLYSESHESGRAFVADGMEVKKSADVPMGAMWTQTPNANHQQYGYNADDRESASVAHIYGQNVAAAESFTAAAAPWGWSPATLKPTADQEMLNGINRFVIHESAHQPMVGKVPGLTLGPFGQWFNRNETWSEQAGPWIDYLARSSYMLQQGHFAADIVYFYGEDSNLTSIFADKAPDLPAGYGFDYINADALIHELTVTDDRITTRSGMSYKLLVLDPRSCHMSLPVLRALRSLVQAGAVITGSKPTDTPSLADDLTEFERIAVELFGDGTGVHKVGKGKVYAGVDAATALHGLDISPDFDCSNTHRDSRIEFVHRITPDADIYFIDNRSDHEETLNATFRLASRKPEVWRAEGGTVEPVTYQTANGHTRIPLSLEAWGTEFVVFHRRLTVPSSSEPMKVEIKLAAVEGPWRVTFQPNRGAPDSITFPQLISWSTSTSPGVKYYSGAANYTNMIDAPAAWFTGRSHLWLDLGGVKDLASVSVNGKDVGLAWHAPYRVDVTSVLKPGKNSLIITVTNLWVNRLIGDQQPNAIKYTYSDVTPYHAYSPLLPSGLLGPVQIINVVDR